MQPYSNYTHQSSNMDLSYADNGGTRGTKRKFDDLSGTAIQSWPKKAQFNNGMSAKEYFADTSKAHSEIRSIYQQIVTKQFTNKIEFNRAHCRIRNFLKVIEENENISFTDVMMKYYSPLKTEFPTV
jgi:hypothetical protein